MTSIRSREGKARPLLVLLVGSLFSGCANTKATVSSSSMLPPPSTEKELAMRKLQEPLEQTTCKVAIYPTAKQDWQVQRLQALVGRGKSFETALEALCREVEGRKLPAVVDIYYGRVPSGWSPNFEVRGTAVRFEGGFSPPPPPSRSSIHPPEMPTNIDVEPAPAGERSSSRHRKRAGFRDHAAAQNPNHRM